MYVNIDMDWPDIVRILRESDMPLEDIVIYLYVVLHS